MKQSCLLNFTTDPRKDKAERRKRARKQQRIWKHHNYKMANPAQLGMVNYVLPLGGDDDSPSIIHQFRRIDLKEMLNIEKRAIYFGESPAIGILEEEQKDCVGNYFIYTLKPEYKEELQKDFEDAMEDEILSIWEKDLDIDFDFTIKQLTRLSCLTKDRIFYGRALSYYTELCHGHTDRLAFICDMCRLIKDMRKWISQLAMKFNDSRKNKVALSFSLVKKCCLNRPHARSHRRSSRSAFARSCGSDSNSGDSDQPDPLAVTPFPDSIPSPGPGARAHYYPSYVTSYSKRKYHPVKYPVCSWRMAEGGLAA
jgi:hypothetical protein